MDADMAAALGLPSPEGVLLTALHPQSPLALAGLQPRDVITSLGGAPTNTPQEMLFRLASAGLGATLPLTYIRGGTPAETTITLAAAPDTPDRQATTLTETSPLRGLGLALINPAVIEEFNLPLDATGTVVTSVEDFAAQTGLAPGDILLAINGTAIATPADAATAAREPTRRWSIDLNRQGQITRLRFRL
jgi:S1-C subfamily serine protease